MFIQGTAATGHTGGTLVPLRVLNRAAPRGEEIGPCAQIACEKERERREGGREGGREGERERGREGERERGREGERERERERRERERVM